MLRVPLRALLATIGALACAGPLAADPAVGAPSPIPSREERHRILALDAHARPGEPDPRGAGAPAQDSFDVTHYAIAIDFDDVARTISGNVTVTATSLVDGLQYVELDLRNNMTVSQVSAGPLVLPHTHQGHLLGVTLASPVAAGQPFSITVGYAGAPQPSGFGTFGWNKYQDPNPGLGQMVWSLSEPQGARRWWPCKDRPDDKALVEEWWTVRDDWTATGNGVLVEVEQLPGNRRRYHWRATHPLTTYLVSVAATNYVSFSHVYAPLAGGSMPIVYYVYPEHLVMAQTSFNATAPILGFFAQTFGEYPFVVDKYGMSAFPFYGGMEHSTNTSYGYLLINGTNQYDWLNAHETAHQWWGDSVSPETWADIWLNEGFASYCEALWQEHLGGAPALRAYMLQFQNTFFTGSVYNPVNLFGSTVYDKGAWVLHMLRRVMGDAAFFDGLRQWYQSHFDGVGNTAQFRASQEARYGGDLGWFFDPWVYGTGMPAYQYGVTTANLGGGSWRSYVRIRQVQGGAPFTMPIDLTFVTDAGHTVHTVWNDATEQEFVIDVPAPPTIVRFDYYNWILDSAIQVITLDDPDADGVPAPTDNCPATVNPAQADLDLDGAGDPCDADDDGDFVPDAEDCAPADAGQGTPAEVASLHLAGSTLSWTAAALADSYDVSRGNLHELAAGYGDCLSLGVRALSFEDTALPPPGTGFQYLVRGVDAGCGGAGPAGTDSAGAPHLFPCP